MKSFREIIDAFGAPSLAKILGVARTHVHVMRVRNSIPPSYWRKIVEAPRPDGMAPITLSMLDDLYVASKVSSEAAE
jgi:hypothetical protein